MIRCQFTRDWYHFYFQQIYTDFTANNKMWCLFCHYLFLISPYFDASWGLCCVGDCGISWESSLISLPEYLVQGEYDINPTGEHEIIMRAYGPRHVNIDSGRCGQRRARSACASAQSDQGLRCPLTESLDTIERINGEQMSRWDLRRRGMNLIMCILLMLENIFSLGAAHIVIVGFTFCDFDTTLPSIQSP